MLNEAEKKAIIDLAENAILQHSTQETTIAVLKGDKETYCLKIRFDPLTVKHYANTPEGRKEAEVK